MIVPLLAACGGAEEKEGAQIEWIQGTARPTVNVPTPVADMSQQMTQIAGDIATRSPTKTPTPVPTPTYPPTPVRTPLAAAQLETYKPNELGDVIILEYHQFTTDPNADTDFVRYVGNFKNDLQWLYDHDFYVVPLRDIILNQINAPLGKHPVALTFDDSTAGQFRFLDKGNGKLEIDPNSAVAIMEEFYEKHPDFGRGGFFAALPPESICFSWVEEDQNPYCQQKMTWLLDHGYEIGNHTLSHLRIDTLDDEELIVQIAEPFVWFQRYDKRAFPDILSVPFGQYPESDRQKSIMRDGFQYLGTDYKLIGSLMVGANPAPSPNSTDWDPLYIPRIQVAEVEGEFGTSGYWFPQFVDDPSQLYTSDGDPDVVTVPIALPVDQEGTLNVEKIAREGKALVRY